MSTGTAARCTTLAAIGGASLLLLAACGGGGGAPYGGGSSGHPSQAAHVIGAIAVAKTPAGSVLVDPRGRTLYVFARDSRGHSACTGSCATYWPPVPGTDAKRGATAAVGATLGSIKRADGTSQLTANGYPVYTYVGDHAAARRTGRARTSPAAAGGCSHPPGHGPPTRSLRPLAARAAGAAPTEAHLDVRPFRRALHPGVRGSHRNGPRHSRIVWHILKVGDQVEGGEGGLGADSELLPPTRHTPGNA